MSTRISNNSPAIQTAPPIASAEPASPTATTAPTTPSKTQPETIDSWQTTDTSTPLLPTDSRLLPQSTPDSQAQEFSVKDALLASPSTQAAATPSRTENPPKDVEKLEDRRDVQILTKLLDDNNGKIPSRLQACLNGVLYDKNSSLSSLTDLLDNKEALRTHLSNLPGSSTKVADKLIKNLEENVRSRIGEAIAANVRPQIENARQAITKLNESPESRREILSSLAAQTGDPAVIQKALQEIGIPSADAKNLATTLAQAHGDPEKLTSIATGDPGPKNVGDWNGTRSEFANTEKQLCKLLNKLESSLKSLHNSVGNGQIKHDRILTNPNFELARNEVLKKLNAVCSPADQVNTLGRIFNEGVADSKKADQQETVLKSALIDVSVDILDKMKFAAPLTESLKLGLKAPDLIVAFDDVHLANAAHLSGLATSENIEQKELMKDAVIATTIADALAPEFSDINISAEDLVKAKNFVDTL